MLSLYQKLWDCCILNNQTFRAESLFGEIRSTLYELSVQILTFNGQFFNESFRASVKCIQELATELAQITHPLNNNKRNTVFLYIVFEKNIFHNFTQTVSRVILYGIRSMLSINELNYLVPILKSALQIQRQTFPMMRSENGKQLNCKVYCIFFLYELNCNGIDLNQRLTTEFIYSSLHRFNLYFLVYRFSFGLLCVCNAISCYT